MLSARLWYRHRGSSLIISVNNTDPQRPLLFAKNPSNIKLFSVLRPISDAPGSGLFCVYAVFKHAWENLGSLDFSLGSLIFRVGSLDFSQVRWFYGCSLDYCPAQILFSFFYASTALSNRSIPGQSFNLPGYCLFSLHNSSNHSICPHQLLFLVSSAFF